MVRMRGFSSLFLRLALGLSFLSAVADRFGLWGAFGQPNVSWGSFARFIAYTGKLNWFERDLFEFGYATRLNRGVGLYFGL